MAGTRTFLRRRTSSCISASAQISSRSCDRARAAAALLPVRYLDAHAALIHSIPMTSPTSSSQMLLARSRVGDGSGTGLGFTRLSLMTASYVIRGFHPETQTGLRPNVRCRLNARLRWLDGLATCEIGRG